jgi:hypothetical protein
MRPAELSKVSHSDPNVLGGTCEFADGIDPNYQQSLRSRFSEAIATAQELFPGRVEIERRHDPEFPQSSAVVIIVTASGDPADIVRRRREWHKRTRSAVDNSTEILCLSILATA